MEDSGDRAVYIDMDTVLLAMHQGQRGMEIGVQANIAGGLQRLAQISDQIVVLAFPDQEQLRGRPDVQSRIQTLRDELDGSAEQLVIVSCPHDEPAECDCAKPASGLIDLVMSDRGLKPHSGWFIGADQEGVQSGRGAGLRTVRIGPLGSDHLSSVHKPDYEARDLLDAANHIMIEDLR